MHWSQIASSRKYFVVVVAVAVVLVLVVPS